MRRKMKRILAVLAACVALLITSIAPQSPTAYAAVYMGGSPTVYCYGTPSYGSNPLISCSYYGGRYAARTVKYPDPFVANRCDVYVQYGSAYKYSWGVQFYMRSYTYAGYQWC